MTQDVHDRDGLINELKKLNADLGFMLINNQYRVEEAFFDNVTDKMRLLRKSTISIVKTMSIIRDMFSYRILGGKFDLTRLSNKYFFDKNYLIKMKEQLDFLKNSNFSNFFNLTDGDPFLLQPAEKTDNKTRTVSVSEEEMKEIKKSKYIILEDLIYYQLGNSKYNSYRTISPIVNKSKYSDQMKINLSNGLYTKQSMLSTKRNHKSKQMFFKKEMTAPCNMSNHYNEGVGNIDQIKTETCKKDHNMGKESSKRRAESEYNIDQHYSKQQHKKDDNEETIDQNKQIIQSYFNIKQNHSKDKVKQAMNNTEKLNNDGNNNEQEVNSDNKRRGDVIAIVSQDKKNKKKVIKEISNEDESKEDGAQNQELRIYIKNKKEEMTSVQKLLNDDKDKKEDKDMSRIQAVKKRLNKDEIINKDKLPIKIINKTVKKDEDIEDSLIQEKKELDKLLTKKDRDRRDKDREDVKVKPKEDKEKLLRIKSEKEAKTEREKLLKEKMDKDKEIEELKKQIRDKDEIIKKKDKEEKERKAKEKERLQKGKANKAKEEEREEKERKEEELLKKEEEKRKAKEKERLEQEDINRLKQEEREREEKDKLEQEEKDRLDKQQNQDTIVNENNKEEDIEREKQGRIDENNINCFIIQKEDKSNQIECPDNVKEDKSNQTEQPDPILNNPNNCIDIIAVTENKENQNTIEQKQFEDKENQTDLEQIKMLEDKEGQTDSVQKEFEEKENQTDIIQQEILTEAKREQKPDNANLLFNEQPQFNNAIISLDNNSKDCNDIINVNQNNKESEVIISQPLDQKENLINEQIDCKGLSNEPIIQQEKKENHLINLNNEVNHQQKDNNNIKEEREVDKIIQSNNEKKNSDTINVIPEKELNAPFINQVNSEKDHQLDLLQEKLKGECKEQEIQQKIIPDQDTKGNNTLKEDDVKKPIDNEIEKDSRKSLEKINENKNKIYQLENKVNQLQEKQIENENKLILLEDKINNPQTIIIQEIKSKEENKECCNNINNKEYPQEKDKLLNKEKESDKDNMNPLNVNNKCNDIIKDHSTNEQVNNINQGKHINLEEQEIKLINNENEEKQQENILHLNNNQDLQLANDNNKENKQIDLFSIRKEELNPIIYENKDKDQGEVVLLQKIITNNNVLPIVKLSNDNIGKVKNEAKSTVSQKNNQLRDTSEKSINKDNPQKTLLNNENQNEEEEEEEEEQNDENQIERTAQLVINLQRDDQDKINQDVNVIIIRDSHLTNKQLKEYQLNNKNINKELIQPQPQQMISNDETNNKDVNVNKTEVIILDKDNQLQEKNNPIDGKEGREKNKEDKKPNENKVDIFTNEMIIQNIANTQSEAAKKDLNEDKNNMLSKGLKDEQNNTKIESINKEFTERDKEEIVMKDTTQINLIKEKMQNNTDFVIEKKQNQEINKSIINNEAIHYKRIQSSVIKKQSQRSNYNEAFGDNLELSDKRINSARHNKHNNQ